MEHYKISKVLNYSTISKFVKRKWVKVNDLLGSQYSANKNMRFKTTMVRSDLYDYSDEYIVVKRVIAVEDTNVNHRADKKVTLNNNSPFRSCISKINKPFIDNIEELHLVMAMHHPLEYSDNYSMTSGNMWTYCRSLIIPHIS